MAIRSKLVAGNWKMNGLRQDGAVLAHALKEYAATVVPGTLGCEVLLCPPATLLSEVGGVLAGTGIGLGGQDCHAAPKGAHTGDISAEMLADLGCTYVILGHSERRQNHHETDAEIRDKVTGAWRTGLTTILCVGETQEQRQTGKAVEIVSSQLDGSIPNAATAAGLVIAYEPVWAIGTGLTPTTADIAAMHAEIRRRTPAGVRILYGGSVNSKNCLAVLSLPEVDGALVGGASLNADDFWAIVRSYAAE
jgi:triosephosphate isomerase (TIM)